MDPVSKAQNEGSKPANRVSRGNPHIADVGLKTRFKPGQSGNPTGRPKKKPITEIFESILAKKGNRKEIEETVLSIVTGGRMASVLMLREMAERVEGKVTQPVDVTGSITDLTDEELKLRLQELISKG